MHPKTIDMGLARVTSVARTLGVDKPSSRVITVGGTNGKGSTVAHMEAILRVAGGATGMFTSPHFIRYNERIRVGGVEVGDAELISAFERIEAARGSTTLTFFEYNALAALLIFADRSTWSMPTSRSCARSGSIIVITLGIAWSRLAPRRRAFSARAGPRC